MPPSKVPPRLLLALITTAGSVATAWVTALYAAPPAAKDAITEKGQQLETLNAQIDELSAKLAMASQLQLPIGSIVPSILSPSRFSSVNGGSHFDPQQSSWVPADGRSVAGSAYARHIGSAVPDLRGLFLRGLNYSEDDRVRAPIDGDPQLDRQPGTIQRDAFQGHGHQYEIGANLSDYKDGAFRGTTGTDQYSNGRVLSPTKLGSYGEPRVDVETRPKNAAVFYYVRIN